MLKNTVLRTVRELTVALSLIAPRSERWIAERSTTIICRTVLSVWAIMFRFENGEAIDFDVLSRSSVLTQWLIKQVRGRLSRPIDRLKHGYQLFPSNGMNLANPVT